MGALQCSGAIVPEALPPQKVCVQCQESEAAVRALGALADFISPSRIKYLQVMADGFYSVESVMPLFGALLWPQFGSVRNAAPRHSILRCYWPNLPDRAFISNWRTNNPALDRTEMDKISRHLAGRR